MAACLPWDGGVVGEANLLGRLSSTQKRWSKGAPPQRPFHFNAGFCVPAIPGTMLSDQSQAEYRCAQDMGKSKSEGMPETQVD